MKNNVVAGAIAGIALIVGVIAALYVAPPTVAPEQSTVYLQRYPAPRTIDDFVLQDQHGQAFSKDQLRGHWTLAFVGYTFCPDICPTTLAALSRIYPQLAALDTAAPVQVLFISVDPQRDTSERLADYIRFFNPEFVAATAEHAVLFPLVRHLGMMYSIAESTDNPNYLVDHSASVVVINPQAEVIGRFRPVVEPGQLAISDSEQILADMPILVKQG